jgi:hypothetical protein
MNIAERQKPPPGELYLDHVAHFVPDLGAAARLAESLGFAVTPESAHRAQGAPAGTSNRCIMLEHGYIEILAPTLDTPNAQRVRSRMARYDGVHLACFGTPDAQAEHGRLAAHGFEPEPLVALERTLENGDRVRFRVVYVPPARMSEGRIQYVQHLSPEVIWTAASLAHDNSVIGLEAVYVVAEHPGEVAARWARFSGLLPRPDGPLVQLDCARGRVVVGTRQALDKLLGSAPPAPGIAGYALSFRDPQAFLARCTALRIERHGEAVVLPPALGGAWLIARAAAAIPQAPPG